jgi:hypothetical protein
MMKNIFRTSAMALATTAVLCAAMMSSCNRGDDPKPDPVITIAIQPTAPVGLTEGSIPADTRLTVEASVTEGAELTCQWYSNTSATGTGGTAVSGATAASYTLPTDLTAGTYHYFVEVAAEGAKTVRSNAVTVTVGTHPDVHVSKTFVMTNRLDSDIVVELSDGDKEVTTIRPGETKQIHALEFDRPYGIAVDLGPEVLWAKMWIDGKLMPAFVWWRQYWNMDREESDPYNLSFAFALTADEDLLERLSLETDLVSVTSDYKVVNLTQSDVVVNMKSYDYRETTIKPGETGLIYDEYRAEWRKDVDMTYDISDARLFLYAGMKIGGEVVPDAIWQGKHWTADVDAENYHHTCILTITDDLLNTILNEQR